MSEERLVAVETKLAYAEDTVETLNDIVVEQRARLERLERRVAELSEQLAAMTAAGDDAPPPHY